MVEKEVSIHLPSDREPGILPNGRESGMYGDYRIGTDIENVGKRFVDIYKAAPTLGELRYAFELDPSIRKNAVERIGYGEITSSFLRNGMELIERPEAFVRTKRGAAVKGGRVYRVKPPPNGWVVEYDNVTGFPVRTGKKEEAIERFGETASFFMYNKDGLYIISRENTEDGLFKVRYGPFFLRACFRPWIEEINIGSRSCRLM
ncbi:MAG: hypothetical protein NT120_03190 [Candidatus Aenigmarchaeota archaeon]|nr:hypothetical protein [Candidatus Aenigmarchaeota archaeon]